MRSLYVCFVYEGSLCVYEEFVCFLIMRSLFVVFMRCLFVCL